MTADVQSEAPAFLLVTDDTTRDELAETLALLNVHAKELSRRGKVGTLSTAYTIQHQRMNAVLTDLLARPA